VADFKRGAEIEVAMHPPLSGPSIPPSDGDPEVRLHRPQIQIGRSALCTTKAASARARARANRGRAPHPARWPATLREDRQSHPDSELPYGVQAIGERNCDPVLVHAWLAASAGHRLLDDPGRQARHRG
jgi:hypothetical protein